MVSDPIKDKPTESFSYTIKNCPVWKTFGKVYNLKGGEHLVVPLRKCYHNQNFTHTKGYIHVSLVDLFGINFFFYDEVSRASASMQYNMQLTVMKVDVPLEEGDPRGGRGDFFQFLSRWWTLFIQGNFVGCAHVFTNIAFFEGSCIHFQCSE